MLHRFIILIVHDEPLIARKFQEILGVRWSVIFVGTAPKIIEHTLHTKPHLIICDVEFFSNLRKILDNEVDNTNIPIICISDFDTIGYEIAAFEAGAIDFLKQPFVPEIIRARVERILQWRIETNVLRQRANLDGLTGLFNRRHFDEKFEEEWQRQRRTQNWLTVGMVDIDYFKEFNDYFGHVKGDECLTAVAKCLAQLVRRPGEFVARYGGEEFVFVLPYLPPQHSEEFGQMVCEAVRAMQYPHTTTRCKNLSVSVGVAGIIPGNDSAASELLKRADNALYKAKASGRDCSIVHDPVF